MLYVASLSKEDAWRTVHSFHYLIFHQILRFVREWSSLTPMKQRMIRKSGQLFRSPVLALEEIAKQQTKQNSTKRYGLPFFILYFIVGHSYFYRSVRHFMQPLTKF